MAEKPLPPDWPTPDHRRIANSMVVMLHALGAPRWDERESDRRLAQDRETLLRMVRHSAYAPGLEVLGKLEPEFVKSFADLATHLASAAEYLSGCPELRWAVGDDDELRRTARQELEAAQAVIERLQALVDGTTGRLN